MTPKSLARTIASINLAYRVLLTSRPNKYWGTSIAKAPNSQGAFTVSSSGDAFLLLLTESLTFSKNFLMDLPQCLCLLFMLRIRKNLISLKMSTKIILCKRLTFFSHSFFIWLFNIVGFSCSLSSYYSFIKCICDFLKLCALKPSLLSIWIDFPQTTALNLTTTHFFNKLI